MNRHSRARWHNLSFLLPVLGAVSTARASPTNRTVDDADGDIVTGDKPQFLPSNGWAQGSQCSGCKVQLDHNQVFHGTWSDATVPATGTIPWNITIGFTGTAVYVYNAVANSVPGTRTDQDITFLIDGAEVGSYVHAATSSTDADYRVLVFSKDQLPNTAHTLLIQPNPNSNILFDYAEYTFDDSPSTTTDGTTTNGSPTGTGSPEGSSSSSKSSPVKTAVIAAVVSVAGVVIIVGFLFLLRRRRHRRSGPRVILDPDMGSVRYAEKPHDNGRHVPRLPDSADGGGQDSALLTTDGYPNGSGPSEYGSGSGSGPSELSGTTAFRDASSGHFSMAGSSVLAPLPASHSAQRHHYGAPASPPPTTATAIQSELAALRDEVARLRQEQQAAGGSGSASGSASSPTTTAAATSPRGEKSKYEPVVLSPQTAQQNELSALREEVMRLRQEQAHGPNLLLDDVEAPPEYEAEARR